MEPLSLPTRRVYAIISFVIFIVVLPLAGLYASGYRFQKFSLIETGAVYVSVPVANAVISLNGEEEKTSTFFTKSFFLDNLDPGSYVLQVEAPGYRPWTKKLVVASKVVTDSSAFLVAQPLSVKEVVQGKAPAGQATTTTDRFVSANEYLAMTKAFATTTAPLATSTDGVLVEKNSTIGLFIEQGNLVVRWMKESADKESRFCIKPGSCVDSFFIENGSETVTNAVLYGGGVLYRTKESGVYFAEADVRPPFNVVPVYQAPGVDFRLVSNAVIVKQGKVFYDIEGLAP